MLAKRRSEKPNCLFCFYKIILFFAAYRDKATEKVFAAFRPKDFIIGTFLGILCQMIFQQIYQKIRFYQNLIIRLVYIGVGVMVSHQIADPVDHFCGQPRPDKRSFASAGPSNS